MKERKENGPADSKAVPRCAVESDGLGSDLIPELCVGPFQVDSFPRTAFLRRAAKEELLEED